MSKIITVPNFEDGAAILEFIRETSLLDSFALDFSQIGFASPSGMVVLAHSINLANRQGKIEAFQGAQNYGYPANVGFFEACGLNVPRYEADGGANYYPLTIHDLNEFRAHAGEQGKPIGAYVNERVGRLAYLITRRTSGSLFDLVKYCLREMMRNAAEHSEADELYVCGQYWPRNNKVELAILDNGIGLKSSLKRNESFSNVETDLDAIRLALLPSVSGVKPIGEMPIADDTKEKEWENSGFGLYVTSQLARECGEFSLISGSAWQFLKGQTKADVDFQLNGTFVSIVLDVAELQRTETRIAQIVAKGESFAKRHLASGADVLASAASKFIVN